MSTPNTPVNGAPHKLTPKQQRFVLEYLQTSNASEAYRRAYPVSLRWTVNTLKSQASRMLHRPYIAQALADTRLHAVGDAIASLKERKTALTRIIRNMEPGPYSPQVAISAMEQLNRMEQVYNDHDTQSTTHNTLVLQGFTVEQLRELLAATQQKGQLQP